MTSEHEFYYRPKLVIFQHNILLLTLTLTQFISDNNNRITQMLLNYIFTTTNEIKITHFTTSN